MVAILTIVLLTILKVLILKSFIGTIIMGPGQYNYHGFMIIAQPQVASSQSERDEYVLSKVHMSHT